MDVDMGEGNVAMDQEPVSMLERIPPLRTIAGPELDAVREVIQKALAHERYDSILKVPALVHKARREYRNRRDAKSLMGIASYIRLSAGQKWGALLEEPQKVSQRPDAQRCRRRGTYPVDDQRWMRVQSDAVDREGFCR